MRFILFLILAAAIYAQSPRKATCTVTDTGGDDAYVGTCAAGTPTVELIATTANTGAASLDTGAGAVSIYCGGTTNCADSTIPGSGRVVILSLVSGVWQVAAGGGGGTAGPDNQRLTFSAENTKTLLGATHGFTSKDLIVSCYDGSGNKVSGSLTNIHATTFDVTVTWPTGVSFTGYCAVNGSGGDGGGGGGDVSSTRTISTTSPLQGGGDLSADRTLSILLYGSGSRAVAANALGTAENCVKWTAAGLGDAGAPCGSGGGGGGSYVAGIGINSTQLAAGTIAIDSDAVPQKLTGSFSWDAASMATGTCTSTTFTVSGSQTTDTVAEGWPADLDFRLVSNMRVTAADTITISLCNYSGVTIDPLSRVYRITVVQ